LVVKAAVSGETFGTKHKRGLASPLLCLVPHSPRTQWRHIVAPLMCAALVAGSVARSRPAVCYWRTLKMGKFVALLQGPKGLMGGTSLPFILSARFPHRKFCRNRSRVAQAQFVPRGLRKSKTRQWVHFSPRTKWRHIVAPLMCAALVAGSVARSRPAVCYWRTLKMGKFVALLQGPKGQRKATRPKGSCAEGNRSQATLPLLRQGSNLRSRPAGCVFKAQKG